VGQVHLSSLYDATPCCDHLVTLALPEYRGIIDSFLKDVHSGKLTADSISPEYYANLAKKLTGAVTEGLGAASFGADDYRNSLKAYLEQNIYAFSGAKSLTMLEQYNNLLLDEKGEIKPFNQFKKDVLKVDEQYNKTYLEAEYNNAIASAQMAEKWSGLAVFKYLEYRTVGDSRVRPEHAVLDKLILRSDDPRWNRIYPPNAWNCRCTVIPAPDDAIPADADYAKALEKQADIQPYFKDNVGKSKVIYKKDHPYFKRGRYGKVQDLDAVSNYGMRTVDHLYEFSDFPKLDYLTGNSEALEWYQKQAGSLAKSFDVKAADGLTVRFDKSFRAEMLKQNPDETFKFFHKSPEVVKNPDEIWSKLVNGKPQITYLKYYENGPVAVIVDGAGTVRAASVTELSKSGKVMTSEVNKLRRGQLKFKS
jgi:SPP1 gp7 family putative phage head morphogenesis protein